MNSKPPSETKTLRWWPAALILIVALGRLLWIWLRDAQQLQDRVVPTILTVSVTVIALLLWLLLFSRIRWAARLKALGGIVALFAVFLGLFRFEGFSGDLLPMFSFRFGAAPDLADASGSADTPIATSPTDYPQFLGSHRDGVVRGTRLVRDWSSQPPKELWRRDVGESWSAFAVVGPAAVTQEQRGEQEAVARYDLLTGEPVWVTMTTDYRFESPIGGTGPRATPTLFEGAVYSFGSSGVLTRLDLRDGSIQWQHDTLAETGAKAPEWQMSGSPLIVDDLVVVSAGGPDGQSLIAYDQATGEKRWSAGDDPASYSSPSLFELAGKRQVVIRNQGSITGHEPVDGQILWSQPWPGGQPNVAQPLPLPEDRLLVSSGYGIGSTLYQFTSDEAGALEVSEVWQSPRLKAKFTNPVFYEGHVYGLDDGVLVCLDPETGERCWKRGRYGHGQLILVGDLLLLIAEEGDLFLIEANPEEHRVVAELPGALDGKSWNNPALSGKYLLLRDADTAVCYEVALEG